MGRRHGPALGGGNGHHRPQVMTKRGHIKVGCLARRDTIEKFISTRVTRDTCRLFGLYASDAVDIKFSFLDEKHKKSMINQLNNNHDGWGVACYSDDGKPVLVKRGAKGKTVETLKIEMNQLVPSLRSRLFVTHVRKGNRGGDTDENAHPYACTVQEQAFFFAHNGTIKNYKDINENILHGSFKIAKNEIDQCTDSLVFFRLIMQHHEKCKNLEIAIKHSLKNALADHEGANFLLSDGKLLFAYRNGKPLHVFNRDPGSSSYFHAASRETGEVIESKNMSERAVLVASDPIARPGETWEEINDDELVIVHPDLRVDRKPSFSRLAGDGRA